MKKPVLVIMAAGMGSRYGGLKQLEPLGPNGEVILDYSLMDAKKAGFETVVFIIKEAIEKEFKEVVVDRVSNMMNVRLAYQEVEKVPEGFELPEERVKPWGTAHAVLCAKDQIDGPFMVINADDYYGSEAFEKLYNFLSEKEDEHYAMVGYEVRNTLSENGTVSRGVTDVHSDHSLKDVVEILNLEEKDNQVGYLEDGEFKLIDQNALVSMNCWGFSHDFLDKLEEAFPKYLKEVLETNPIKGEIYLPTMVKELLLNQGKPVTVLSTSEKWFGITYPEDKPQVKQAVEKMHQEGKY